MRKLLALALIVVAGLAGCQLPPERAPLRPLPEDGGPLPYAELLTRVRTQASQATEAFYLNRWADLEDSARGLEQTAKYLGKAEDVPVGHKDTLPVLTGDLAKNAEALRESASAQDVKKAKVALASVIEKVHELRLNK